MSKKTFVYQLALIRRSSHPDYHHSTVLIKVILISLNVWTEMKVIVIKLPFLLVPPSFSFVSSGQEEAVCPESGKWWCDIKQGLLVLILDCVDILEFVILYIGLSWHSWNSWYSWYSTMNTKNYSQLLRVYLLYSYKHKI